MKSILLKITCLSLLVLLYGCADDRVIQNQASAQKQIPQQSSDEMHLDPRAMEKNDIMTNKDPNALDNKDNVVSSVRVQTESANHSRSLSEIAKEQGEIKRQNCEDQFKNEQGVCEVPNQVYPHKK